MVDDAIEIFWGIKNNILGIYRYHLVNYPVDANADWPLAHNG